MNWLKKPLLFGFGGLLLTSVARGDVNAPENNVYHVVVERNPFGLNPPKPTPPITNTPPAQKLDVKFTGITVDKAGKKAWLVVPPPPNNRTQNPQYLSLREQETQGDIQVLEIDEKENKVKIINAGTPAVLTFKENGYATPTAAAIPGTPGLPTGVPGVLPAPGGLPIPGGLPGSTTPVPGIRTAGNLPQGVPANEALAARYGLQNTAPGSTPTIGPIRTIPTRALRTPPDQQQGVGYPQLPPVPGK